MMRLNRFLAIAGIAARRKADELIRQGRVAVNGRLVENPGVRIDEYQDAVTVDGKSVKYCPEFVYILLNKPRNCLSSVSDNFKRPTVVELVNAPQRVFPVGRLDFDTEGVLLLTNDGQLAYRLMHPRYEVDKVYVAELDRPIDTKDVLRLRKGVSIGEKKPVRARVQVKNSRKVELTIHEGKKRQIKRMLKSLGYQVQALQRTKFGILECKDLKPAQWRYLSRFEVKQLRKSVGL